MLKKFNIMCVFALTLCTLLIPLNAFSANFSARSSIVVDMRTGENLFANNENEPLSMASTTKIMTALLTLESGKCAKTVVITKQMLSSATGTLLYLKEGDRITLYDLAAAMLIVSGNDCADASAIAVAGSIEDFVHLMNKRADKIGMENTVFVTPSGLDSKNHHSTARDMALLTCEALKNESFAKIVCSPSMKITVNGEEKTIYNHNKLLKLNP